MLYVSLGKWCKKNIIEVGVVQSLCIVTYCRTCSLSHVKDIYSRVNVRSDQSDQIDQNRASLSFACYARDNARIPSCCRLLIFAIFLVLPLLPLMPLLPHPSLHTLDTCAVPTRYTVDMPPGAFLLGHVSTSAFFITLFGIASTGLGAGVTDDVGSVSRGGSAEVEGARVGYGCSSWLTVWG